MTNKITWVDEIPKADRGRGKTSRWQPVVDELVSRPGRAALVGTYASADETEGARTTLRSHAKTRGVKLDIHVRGTKLYALAKKRGSS